VQRLLLRFLDRTPESDSSIRMLRAIVLLLIGLSVGVGAAAADIYLHRGIESGAEFPYVLQTTGRELAINVDLMAFPPEQIEQIATVLENNGYRYVRQSFSWSAIEPQRGTYDWTRYDQLVTAMAEHSIQVVAVLHDSPDWARIPGQIDFPDAPPALPSDFSIFVGQVVKHFQERVLYYQIWDLPNRPDRWGGADVIATDYLKLLAEGFNAARSSNSEAKIILAEFDPMYSDGTIGADLAFLRLLYRVGVAPFFDIATARIDGGSYTPYDRQVNSSRKNLARVILFRELLDAQGDREKPVWMSHFGWDASNSGPVTREEQADFLLAAIKRARAEWPWMGLMFSWSLLPDSGVPAEAGYSLLDATGSRTPAFTDLSEFSAEGSFDVAPTGFVPMDSSQIIYSGNWADQHLNRRTFRTTAETGASATLSFRGTGLIALLRISPQAGPILATIDGAPIPGWPLQDGASFIDLESFQAQDLPIALADNLDDQTHVLTLTLADKGQLTIGGLVVSREPPLLWPVIVLILIAFAIVTAGLRDLVYYIALQSRVLQQRSGIDLRPALPKLPDWQPTRRF